MKEKEPVKKTTRPAETLTPATHIPAAVKPTPLTAADHITKAIDDLQAFINDRRGSGLPLIAYQGMVRTLQRQLKIIDRRRTQFDRA